jgi:cardiolipin synthase
MEQHNEENERLYLLKEKGKKGLVNLVFSRIGIVVLALLVQVIIFLLALNYILQYMHVVYIGLMVLTFIAFIYLLNSRSDRSVVISWMIVFTLSPLLGGFLYVFTKFEFGHRLIKAVLIRNKEAANGLIGTDKALLKTMKATDPEFYGLTKYISSTGSYPVYENTAVTYFPLGEDKFQAMIEELEKAEKFIFMEYFIVDEGIMWGTILNILAKKVQQGVEVRFMYDGFCEFSVLPHDYPKKMAALGIKCRAFSPVHPFVSTAYNFRDHRKICVIDGKVAFTGGVNLADEYINQKERFGHWKDTAVMLKGKACESFTLMFLQMWYLRERTLEFDRWLEVEQEVTTAPGLVMPYGDDPLDNDRIGEIVYFDILNQSIDYVHIMTPYLILDGEMETALTFAARRGIDVKLILPHIPDKKMAFALAKSHYKVLLEAGVKIYEYTPGFVHAKVFVSDDSVATVGTINLDYRSFYHHFECGVLMRHVPAIADIEKDFQETLAKSQAVTLTDVANEKLRVKLTGWLMKTVAPLM